MKKTMSMLVSIVFSAMCLSGTIAYAASGNQGYAVYRDGVLAGLEWHTGILVESSATFPLPISHALGSGHRTELTSYSGFVGDNAFMGTYRPKSSSLSDNTRNLVVATARFIASESIKYEGFYQMLYTSSKPKVTYNEISAIRCDGVVEYCYEYNFVRIFGSDALWDISQNNIEERDHHYATRISPLTQADQYMSEIS